MNFGALITKKKKIAFLYSTKGNAHSILWTWDSIQEFYRLVWKVEQVNGIKKEWERLSKKYYSRMKYKNYVKM